MVGFFYEIGLTRERQVAAVHGARCPAALEPLCSTPLEVAFFKSQAMEREFCM